MSERAPASERRGVNDLRLGDDEGDYPQVRKAFANALRAVVSRYNSAVVFEDSDSSVVKTSGAWTTTSSVDKNSGSGYIESSTVGAKLTITVPVDFEGGTVAVQFVGGAASGASSGAAVDISVDGGTAVTVLTSDIGPTATTYAPVCHRITGLAPGTHTITLTRLDSPDEVLRFDC